MIDLCIDARMAFSSGIGTCIREIVPYLNAPPFRLFLLVQEEQKWASEIEQIRFSAPIYSIQEQIGFPFKIPSCDLFWSPHYNIPLTPIRAKKRVVTIHDACHLALPHLLSMPERKIARWLMGQAMQRSDAVATDSLFSQKELIRYLGSPRSPIHVIPIGVNRNRFYRIDDPQSKENLKKKYGIPDRFSLFVGNLKPHKNISALLEAFSSPLLSNESLVLIGKCKELRNPFQIASSERIFPIGEIPDAELPIFYSMAENLIFPSFYEGFGLPPLEAMSCGCPTICSNAASIPEICEKATLYIDPKKPLEIAAALISFQKDPELKGAIIQKGYERVAQFNWDETASQYRTLFEKVLYHIP